MGSAGLDYLTHPGEGSVFKTRGDVRPRHDKFVILAPMQSQINFSSRVARDSSLLDSGGNARFFEDVCQVDGESIAYVDHGGGARTDRLTDSVSGRRIQVSMDRIVLNRTARFQESEAPRRAAQGPSNEDSITRLRTATGNGSSWPDMSDDRHVNENGSGHRRVAAHQLNFKVPTGSGNTVEEVLSPLRVQI